MKNLIRALTLATLALGFVSYAAAGDTVTMTGKITCAKCSMHVEGVKECQNVLVVTGDNAGNYYIVKNEAMEKFGHACKGEKAATVTGTVEMKDGKSWLTATKVEAPAKS
jgi:type 1 fimbria pilin